MPLPLLTEEPVGNTEQDNVNGDNDILDMEAWEELSNTAEYHEYTYGQVGNATVTGISI